MFKNKRGFTLIELLIVIAIIAVLVLLAAPKMLGFTKDAKLAQIKNDIKAYEVAVEMRKAEDIEFIEQSEVVNGSILADFHHFDKLYDKKGLVVEFNGSEEVYHSVPRDLANSKLKGNFAISEGGKVYYYEGKVSGEVAEDKIVTETVSMNFKNDGEVSFPNQIERNGITLSKKGSFMRNGLVSGEVSPQKTKLVKGQHSSNYEDEDGYVGQLDLIDNPPWGSRKVIDVFMGERGPVIYLLDNNELWSVGNDYYGIGGVSRAKSTIPKKIITPWESYLFPTQVSMSNSHVVYLLNNGEVWSAGNNNSGQLGLGHSEEIESEIVKLNFTLNVYRDKIYAEENSTFYMKDGELWAYGSNINGKLGVGKNDALILNPEKVKVPWNSNEKIKSISSSDTATAFSMDNGTVYGAGSFYNGISKSLGSYNVLNGVGKFNLSFNVRQAEFYRTGIIYVTEQGDVYTQGTSPRSNLVAAPLTKHAFPWESSELEKFNIAEDSLMEFTLKSGEIYMWSNKGGVTNNIKKIDVSMYGGSKVIKSAKGSTWNGTLHLLNNGEVWHQGRNDNGEAGDGTTSDNDTPVRVHSYEGYVTRPAVDTGVWKYTQEYEGISWEDTREWSK